MKRKQVGGFPASTTSMRPMTTESAAAAHPPRPSELRRSEHVEAISNKQALGVTEKQSPSSEQHETRVRPAPPLRLAEVSKKQKTEGDAETRYPGSVTVCRRTVISHEGGQPADADVYRASESSLSSSEDMPEGERRKKVRPRRAPKLLRESNTLSPLLPPHPPIRALAAPPRLVAMPRGRASHSTGAHKNGRLPLFRSTQAPTTTTQRPPRLSGTDLIMQAACYLSSPALEEQNLPELDCASTTTNFQSPQQEDEPFPKMLYRAICSAEKCGKSDIVSFNSSGTAFRIHQPQAFEALIPSRFRNERYKQEIASHGFQRITSGPDKDSYEHPLFVRSRPELCHSMQHSSGSKARSTK